MTPVSPENNIIIQIDSKFQDTIETKSGVLLYKDTSYEPGWNATVDGKVVSVPNKVTFGSGKSFDRWRGLIVPEVLPGDHLLFSYMVITDMDMPRNPEHFFPHENSGWRLEWRNFAGDKLIMTRLPDRTVVGQHLDKYDEMISPGRSGTGKEVEKWMSDNFKLGRDDDAVYANLMWINPEHQFWLVDYIFAIAFKRDGELRMIGGNILLEPLEEDRGEYFGGSKIIVPEHLRKVTREGVAKVVSIGAPLKNQKPIDLKAGDTVRFDKRFAEKYKFFGKDYLLIKNRRALAKVI